MLNNRSRTSRSTSKRLQRRRSEVAEQTFGRVCETGGSRRSHVRGLVNVTKRYLMAVAAHNLGRILRKLTGVGSRALHGVGGPFGGRRPLWWGRRTGCGRPWWSWGRESGHGRSRHAAGGRCGKSGSTSTGG
ncbi:transposase [Gemmata algarum]|uniref:transposase n=1 Tax=Gemmata algarum TaxID=2975278 RepID=UPI0038B386F7